MKGKLYFKLRTFGLMVSALFLAGSISIAQSSRQGGRIIAGPDDAPITIEEFADFHCKFCARGSNTIGQILKNYPGKIKLIFRNLPLPMHSPGGLTAAKAFTAVSLLNPKLAYAYQNSLFQNQEKLIKVGEAFLYEVAESMGLNVPEMKESMAGEAVARIILEDQQIAESHKFKGTPSFLIGSEEVVGARPYEDIAKVIDRQLGLAQH